MSDKVSVHQQSVYYGDDLPDEQVYAGRTFCAIPFVIEAATVQEANRIAVAAAEAFYEAGVAGVREPHGLTEGATCLRHSLETAERDLGWGRG